MKKIFMFLAVAGLMAITAQNAVAQDGDQAAAAQTEQVAQADQSSADQNIFNQKSDKPLYQQIKTKFIEGGPAFMVWVVLCLILGLAVAIERIIYLSLATTNNNTSIFSFQAIFAKVRINRQKSSVINIKNIMATNLCK